MYGISDCEGYNFSAFMAMELIRVIYFRQRAGDIMNPISTMMICTVKR
ncbi:MAG: hypothetical protein ACLVAW_20350 [Eisenbergiella massiliensis]